MNGSMEKSRETDDGSIDEELQRVFAGRKSLDSEIISAPEMKQFMKSSETWTWTDIGDVCEKLATVLNIMSKITPSTPVFNFSKTFSILSTYLQKFGIALKSLAKPIEHDEAYSELQGYEDSEIRSEAIGFEKALFNNNAYFNEIDINAPKGVINTLEDKVPVNDIVRFLGKLQAKTQERLFASDVTSARRATKYVNLYFRIAILRKLVLWQVFCIKQRSGHERSTAQGILAMITESQKTDLDMLRYVTEANVEKAVFLTVFHPKENDNFLHFLRIQKFRIPSIGQDKCFYARTHAITLSMSGGVKLEMSSWYKGSINGTTGASDACKFMFEPLNGRNIDNIFYLKSTKWSEYYAIMSKDGTCHSLKEKDKPGLEGQWKVVRFENENGPPQYVVSSMKWPARFLYKETFLWFTSIKSTYDLKIIKERGLWEIQDL